jgi:hypothetical protein
MTMTDTSQGPVTAGSGDPVDDSESRRRAAAEIRRQHPGFVVIWAAGLGKFRAWPLIRAPRGTVLTAETPGDMAAQMERIEQAAARGPRSPGD